MSKRIIAIDGPSASGKSSVSRKLAGLLDCVHVDSGSLYRGLTWKLLQAGIELSQTERVMDAVDRMQFRFFLEGRSVRFTIDGADPGMALRLEPVTGQVSLVAAIPDIRAWVVLQLRDMTRLGELVMEGRDIGTVVFPDAAFKFYLDADPAERARRRHQELAGEKDKANLGQVRHVIERRDELDRGREVAPLKVAADAQVLDTTGMTLDEVVETIAGRIRRAEPLS